MADVVTRLVVDSKEYDSKIQRAVAGLTQYEEKCREVGGTLEYVEKEDLDFVKAIGQMETVSSSATGKLSELKKAFTELSIQYKNLTDAEKQAPYGRALAASLDQLKGRIKTTQADLQSVSKDLNGNGGSSIGGALDALAGKFGMNISQLTNFGVAIGGAQLALKVAKDAFFASDANIDAWGRTVQGAQSVYEGFLTSLNTGDISGFLSRIGEIMSAAQNAYDELDRLGTQKAINNAAQQRQQVENERNRAMLRTGRYIAPNDGRTAEMADGAILTKEQKDKIAKDLQDGLARINKIVRDEIDQTTKSIDALYTQQAKELGMSAEEFRKGTASMEEFDKRLQGYNQYIQYNKETERLRMSLQGAAGLNATNEQIARLNQTNPYSQYKAWGVFRDGGDLFTQINELINQRSSLQTQSYNQQAQAYRSINTAMGVSARGGATKVEVKPVIPEGSAAALKKYIADLQDAWNKASTQDERNSIKGQIDAANEALKAMTPQIVPVAAAIKDAAAMWTEHSQKIADVKARLEEFKAMVTDTSLTDAQRDWAQGMADAYQEQLDKMTGATEEAANNMSESLDKIPTKFELMQESLDKMSTGIGAISTIGNAFNDLKGIGEDLASAFSGEMDAWDALMTVFNSGIGIMQTVIGVMEAINTLQELGNALSDAKVAKQAAETTAVVSGKGAEAAAETAEAAASGTATAANTAEAAAGAGKAMAGIPIVGPVLAIAAIAAVLAAILAATSKAKSAGNYAVGGIVPGSSFSGDNLTANVNSGELILNRAQQGAIAGQLQGAAQQTVMVEGRISGKDILLSANNTNRAAGGSRGYYTKVK